jgi:hypothetical protein
LRLRLHWSGRQRFDHSLRGHVRERFAAWRAPLGGIGAMALRTARLEVLHRLQ